MIVLALLLGSGAVGALAFGADPDSGTVSLENTRVSWKGKEFANGGRTISRRLCDVPADELCDEYTLTADIPADHWKTARGGAEVVIAWEDPQDDFDLYALDRNGAVVDSSTSASGTGERVLIENANRDAGPYRIVVNPYSVDAGSSYAGGALVIDRAKVATGEVPTKPVSGWECRDGTAGGVFPCRDVDLEGFLPIADLNDGEADDVTGDPIQLNDIWGWTDPETGREYALVGKTNGTAFVDITDPRTPRYLGSLPSSQRLADEPVTTLFKTWRDIKVYKDHAFVVSEEPGHGMQVFDLTRLRKVGDEPQTFSEDALYQRVPTVPGFAPTPQAMGNSHNIAINEDSGFAYAIGTDTCQGGPHMIDIREPKQPKFAGCVSEDGYTHDSQCVNYDGPDERFAGREICFNSNEDTLTIVDVTDKDEPRQLARQGYDGAAYTHQGWLTEDQRFFLLDDELDEQTSGVNTTTRIFDVSRLDAPAPKGEYVSAVESIDHNLYTRGTEVFEANYRSGLRVLDARAVRAGRLSEKGFFDVYPQDDAAEFNGAWSNFPYYDSGLVVVSGIEQGLFVLRPRTSATERRSSAVSRSGAARTARPAAGGTSNRPNACAAGAGFESVGARRLGRGLRLGFERRTAAPVRIDVFRTARGRSIGRPRLMARFTGRSQPVRWGGTSTVAGRRVTDGHYLARFRIRTPQGVDTRRIALQRRRGRFVVRRDFARRPGCGLLRKFKLSAPVFGGRQGRSLGIAFRASRDTVAEVRVVRGGETVRRFAARRIEGGRTYRLRLDEWGLRRGRYRVVLSVGSGGELVRTALHSRRL